MGVWVGLVQSVLTYRSKDMPKERRVPLAMSIGISDAIGLAGTLLIDGRVKKFTKRVQDRVDKLPIAQVEKDHLKKRRKNSRAVSHLCVYVQILSTSHINSFSQHDQYYFKKQRHN